MAGKVKGVLTEVDLWKVKFLIESGSLDLAERESIRLALNDLRHQILEVLDSRLGNLSSGDRRIRVIVVDET